MPRTPAQRSATNKMTVAKVRRRHSKNLKKRRKLMPVEQKHVASMIVVLKLSGYTRSQMASIIGVSRGQITEILEEQSTQKLLETLRERLPAAALELMHAYMIEAVQALAHVMRTSNNEKYILQAAESILDRGGVPKASRQERHTINEDKGVVGEDFFERLRTASPEIQEKAAQMVDDLENFLKNSLASEDENEDS